MAPHLSASPPPHHAWQDRSDREWNGTPLLAACSNGNLEIAEELVRAGADVEHGTEQGTPLSMVMDQMGNAFMDQVARDRLRDILRLLRDNGATSAGARGLLSAPPALPVQCASHM